MKKNLVIISGAGISAESGIPTFRDAVTGLWENHDINDVCTAEAIRRDPELVHRFYNELREKYKNAVPNEAHALVASLEKDYNVTIITQNVDGLHEAAGSSNVIHLHGEILKCRDVNDSSIIFDIPEDKDGKLTTFPGMKVNGHEVRPHIVFFHEDVPNFVKAADVVRKADIVVVIGTSLVVYPAAGLFDFARQGVPVYYIDLHPNVSTSVNPKMKVIESTASKGMKILIEELKK